MECPDLEKRILRDEKVVEELRKTVCIRLDVDNAKVIMDEYGVKQVPSLLIINPWTRVVISRHIGTINIPAVQKFIETGISKLGEKPKREEKPFEFTFRYKKRIGFSLESRNKDLVIDIWTFQLAEGIGFLDSEYTGDQFRLRQSRYGIRIRHKKKLTFLTHLEYMQENPLLDMFIEYQVTRPINIRVGRSKVPMGLEFLPRRDFWDFLEEPSFMAPLLPRRDVGVSMYGGGGIANIFMKYNIGVYNGVQDGYTEDNDSKNLALRLLLNPFPSNDFDLTLAVAWTRGEAQTNMADFKITTESLTSIFEYHNVTSYNGDLNRMSVESELLYKNYSLGAELVTNEVDITRPGFGPAEVEMKGLSIWASCILTGENKVRDERLIPASDSGAFEIAIRYCSLDLDSAIAPYAEPGKFTENSWSFTIAFNWYVNTHTKVLLNYIRAEFEDDIEVSPGNFTDSEKAILAGVQISF